MAFITKLITVDVARENTFQSIIAKQYDTNSRFLKVTLTNEGEQIFVSPTSTVTVNALREDNSAKSFFGTVNEDGTVTVPLTNWMIELDGTVKCDISVIDSEQRKLTSTSFTINVEAASCSKTDIIEDENYDILVTLLSDVTDSKRECDAATALATSAAEKANSAAVAADGAENVNISAVQTQTGADITVTDRTGTPTTVHIDTLMNINSWQDVQSAVRLGLGRNLFPVGYEFTTFDSTMGTDITWVVRGHDHHRPANSRLTHSMTLEMKYVYSNANGSQKAVQYNSQGALYYALDGLAAGTYHFTVANQAWFVADNGKSFQFTLFEPIPAGGQVVLSATYNQSFEGKSVKTYVSPYSTAAIETATLAESSGGISLGTTNGEGNINHLHRIVLGSNNYAQSAVRQLLNSVAVAGSVWSPQTKFDRPPTWAGSYSGFMAGLPTDFLEVIEPAIIPCRTNSVFECASLDGTEFALNQLYELKDKFFLLSRPEIYGSWDSATYKDGELLDYYNGLTNTECKKFDKNGLIHYAWLRSPSPYQTNAVRVVSTDGGLNSNYVSYNYGICPACIIA